MRGGCRVALEGRDPGSSRRAQGKLSTKPNQITFLLPISFLCFLFVLVHFPFFYFFLSCFGQGGGDRRGGMQRRGGLVVTKVGIRVRGTVCEQWNDSGKSRVRRTKTKTMD